MVGWIPLALLELNALVVATAGAVLAKLIVDNIADPIDRLVIDPAVGKIKDAMNTKAFWDDLDRWIFKGSPRASAFVAMAFQTLGPDIAKILPDRALIKIVEMGLKKFDPVAHSQKKMQWEKEQE